MYCMDSEESVKGSQAAPTRAPLTDSSESGTRFSDEGKGPSFRRRRRRVPRIGFIRRICFPSERFSETIRFPAEPVPGRWRSEAPFEKLDQVYSSIDQSNL